MSVLFSGLPASFNSIEILLIGMKKLILTYFEYCTDEIGKQINK